MFTGMLKKKLQFNIFKMKVNLQAGDINLSCVLSFLLTTFNVKPYTLVVNKCYVFFVKTWSWVIV